MAFLKKLKVWFKKIFFPPKRRRKIPARKVKKRIIRKSSSRRPVKIKRSSKKQLPEKTTGLLTYAQLMKQNKTESVGRDTDSRNVPLLLRKSVFIGEITHFFPRIQVCVLNVSANGIKVGDLIVIAGKERRFTQKVASLQIESVDVQAARRGDLVGLKLDKPAAVGDKIFKGSE